MCRHFAPRQISVKTDPSEKRRISIARKSREKASTFSHTRKGANRRSAALRALGFSPNMEEIFFMSYGHLMIPKKLVACSASNGKRRKVEPYTTIPSRDSVYICSSSTYIGSCIICTYCVSSLFVSVIIYPMYLDAI